MKKKLLYILATLCAIAAPAVVPAHFQTLLPTTDIVDAQTPGRLVRLDMIFTHPMAQGPVMEMGQPRQFGFLRDGKKTNLLDSLQAKKKEGKTIYQSDVKIGAPGDHVFYIEPAPYWEPAEEKMIVHYTKVVVNAFGQELGWDALVGFPVEIEPLTRPYGLWTGNVFRGIARHEGKPVPFAEIEVEYWNENKQVSVPAAPFETQVIKTDASGVFAYGLPRAGWWAFAALVDGEEKLKNPKGQEVDVELGGLIWVRCRDMK